MRSRGLSIFLFIGVIGLFFFKLHGDVNWAPWAYLTTLSTLTLGYQFTKKLPILLGLMFTFIVLDGLMVIEYRDMTAGMEPQQILALKHLAANALLEFLLLGGIFIGFWKHVRKPLAWGLYAGGLIHTIDLLVEQAVLHIPTGSMELGLLGNRSIGASFTAVWFFFSYYWIASEWDEDSSHDWFYRTCGWLTLLAVPTILVSVSGISYIALLFGMTALIFAICPRVWPLLIGLLIGGMSLGPLIKPQFLDRVSRYPAWALFITFWREHFHSWIGAGLGTFKLWGPVSQQMAHFMEGRWWIWAHNDWLQIFFELGLVGGFLAVLVYMYLLKRAWGKTFLFASLISFGTIMVANYPLHIAAGSLLAWWLVFETVVGDKWSEDSQLALESES